MKTLTEAERRVLNDLLYLATSADEVRATVLSAYKRMRVGNSDMAEAHEFILTLETLLAKSAR